MGKSMDPKQFIQHKNYHGRFYDAGVLHGMKSVSKGVSLSGRRRAFVFRHLRLIAFLFGLMGAFFMLDSLMFSLIHRLHFQNCQSEEETTEFQVENYGSIYNKEPEIIMYDKLLQMAADALEQNTSQIDRSSLWEEPLQQKSIWKPCADKQKLYQGHTAKKTGFIMMSANGGLNQQRVAVCNSVAVAALLNATLVIPKFLYSSVWKDSSQFGDIYQEEYFMNILKDDVNIVKELPSHLQALDIEAVGSLITDKDIMKEATPDHFIQNIIPLLLRNGVVHFLGFGNRLAFDPLPSNIQRLRCKCNFHALQFVPRIQELGSLLVRRIRRYDARQSLLDKQLLGEYLPSVPLKGYNGSNGPPNYLALHLRFEMDMVAYSLCGFGGGEREQNELQAYREIHFPTLVMRMKNKSVSPADLRKDGRCPLTPEEAALVLAALGFNHGTYIYLAGSDIYGGVSRMLPFSKLYPNLVTKEDLLSQSELEPFRNFSSQMAALDFIACATADVFAITDSGSQLSSLVSGYRVYYGEGRAPTLRPNKKRLASIMSENSTIEWFEFEERVRKMIEEAQRVRPRGRGRSIYKQPRSPECMCKT
ncbi:Uncharacterized protein QJS10_CPA01g01810 [Acorus calamus]|uniref:O-fucosyltransferase family protein n=1 Tax=Acorus calamus TaxID=4465 RepID=A0AAV9FKV1_ACOCL|nr:Uncharacterized protein QJS10_CPA01g01810 [Acorus calamus]